VSAAAAAAEPVPSVLPEEGIDLAAELERYRMWMVDQALLLADGNVLRAGKLLGYAHPKSLYKFFHDRAKGASFRRGGAAHHKPAPVAAALPAAEIKRPKSAVDKLVERIDWTYVAEQRAKGARDRFIAVKLANTFGCSKWLVEKALQRPRGLAKCGP